MDTDVDIFCEKGCKWPGSGSKYCGMLKLYWNCSDCKAGSVKHAAKAIAASLAKASAALGTAHTEAVQQLMAALESGGYSADMKATAKSLGEDAKILSTIINKLADQMNK